MITTRPRYGVERWPLMPGVWVERSSPEVWPAFKAHHYLPTHSHSAKCYIAVDADGSLLGFVSTIPQPSRFGGFWREHRLVVLPAARGRGIGVMLSEWLGEQALASGHRYMSRTRNETVAAARDRSPKWRRLKHIKPRTDTQGWERITMQRHHSHGHEFLGCPGSFRLPCRWCGRLFLSHRSHARYCDGACRVAAHRAAAVVTLSP